MDSWRSYPKIYNFGHAAIADIFNEEVIVEEKIDGSQFSFGKFGDTLKCKSKRVELDVAGWLEHNCENEMFYKAVKAASELDLHDGWTYRAEYLQKPKHNALAYDRIPKNHLILFDVNTGTESYLSYEEKAAEAERLGLEIVPILFQGKLEHPEQVFELLKKESCLGTVHPEGVVCKNYARFGVDGKVLMAKYVSEEFKEVHKREWKETNKTSKDILTEIGDQYRSTARWMKAVQRLRDDGTLENSPKDIGALIKEVPQDILDECKEEIAQRLFAWAWPQIKRKTIAGLPQWYKEKLVKDQFGEYDGKDGNDGEPDSESSE